MLQGLLFLDNAGLTHSRFVESQIVADLDGNIKIGESMICIDCETMAISHIMKAEYSGATKEQCYLHN